MRLSSFGRAYQTGQTELTLRASYRSSLCIAAIFRMSKKQKIKPIKTSHNVQPSIGASSSAPMTLVDRMHTYEEQLSLLNVALPLRGITTKMVRPPSVHGRTDPGRDDDLRIH